MHGGTHGLAWGRPREGASASLYSVGSAAIVLHALIAIALGTCLNGKYFYYLLHQLTTTAIIATYFSGTPVLGTSGRTGDAARGGMCALCC